MCSAAATKPPPCLCTKNGHSWKILFGCLITQMACHCWDAHTWRHIGMALVTCATLQISLATASHKWKWYHWCFQVVLLSNRPHGFHESLSGCSSFQSSWADQLKYPTKETEHTVSYHYITSNRFIELLTTESSHSKTQSVTTHVSLDRLQNAPKNN